MDLPEIYDTLQKDTANYADDIDESDGRLYTDWRGRESIDGTDAHKVQVNDPSLAEELDEYKDLIEQYNLISETAKRLPQENAQEYLAKEWHTPTNIEYVMLSAKDHHTSFADEDVVKIGQWALANQNPIVEADSAEELRENLYDAADETGMGAVYEALDARDADDIEDWHDQLWDLVTDDLEEHDGEQYSVQGLLEDRQETDDDLTEMADELQDHLRTNLEDELRDYRPSTGTRLRRTVRKLF